MTNPFLGPSYTNEYIEKNIISILRRTGHNINYKYYENFEEIIEEVCKLLLNKKVIGWFQDKMEWGPRALGNRSIIADPRNENVRDLINLKIKKREDFRPFAPSIMSEFTQDYFDINNNVNSPFMTMVVDAKQKALKSTRRCSC